jgi:spermidine synthase
LIARTLLLFFLSGATSLVYEVVWMRRLSLVFGHSIFSVSTVLTTFMTGLALGSYLGGRWSDQQRRGGRRPTDLLKTYGKLELFIGLWGLLSLLLLNLVEAGFLQLARGGYHGFPLTAFLFFCSFLVLLPPTTAMGATLPVFTQVLVWRQEDTGSFLSKIYGLNTLGACCGAAFGGLVGLPALGLNKTVIVTACLNAAIAALAISLTKGLTTLATPSKAPAEPDALAPLRTGASPPEPVAPESLAPEAQSPAVPGSRWVPLVFGMSGFAGMVYQLGWTRALVLSIGSSTYSFSIILTTFLASLGLGSILYKRLFAHRLPQLRDLAMLQIFISCSALLVTLGIGRLPLLKLSTLPVLGTSFAKVAAFDTAVVLLLLLLPTLALGLTFPLVTHLYTARLDELGKRLGEAYAANTTGAIAGSFLGGFVLLPLIGLQHSIELAACLNLGGGLLLLWHVPSKLSVRRRPELALALATVGLLAFAPSWDLGLLSSGVGIGYQGQRVRSTPIFYRDGVTSTVTVGMNSGLHPFIAVNGKTDASLTPADRRTQLLLGLVPASLHPHPQRVAVIGFGSGQTPVGLLSVPEVKEVRCAELEPAVLEARKFFAPFSEGALEDPRLKTVIDDGRSFILGSPDRFDLIVSEPSNPWIAGIGNLYTEDFYRGCRRQLNEGGLMGQWFHLYAMSEADIQMVYRTFFTVFPEGAIYRTGPGDILLIGGERAPEMRPERLRALFSGDLRSAFWLASLELVEPRMLYATYLASRDEVIAYLDSYGEGFARGPINTDDRPLLEFRAPLSLFSQRGVVAEATSRFTSLVPPAQSQDVPIQQAAIMGRLLLGLPFDAALAVQRLKQLDPQGKAWYPTLLESMVAQQPIDFLSVVSQARPEDRPWLVRLGIAWKVKSKMDDGLAPLYRMALASPPPASRLWLLLGAARDAARLGDLDSARSLYAQALPLTHGDEPLAESGALGSPDQWSESPLRQAISRNPYNARTRYQLATILAKRKKTDEALTHALESHRLYPHNADLGDLLSELYREKGDTERVLHFAALARQQRAIDLARSGKEI